jgi:hypothetical protein
VLRVRREDGSPSRRPSLLRRAVLALWATRAAAAVTVCVRHSSRT